MTGRYRINLNSWRTWEPEKRTAKRWSLFINTCRLLANDGLNYEVTLTLGGDAPHILITAWGTPTRKCRRTAIARRCAAPPLKPQICALHALEADWFLPENATKRNTNTTHWRRRGARYDELNAMAEEQVRAEVEFWRELELLSGQRQHFKPGLRDETAWPDDEVAA
ncbi:MAG: hypothetical protein JWO19_4512 [Bryobacterales bacterium]|nr:hypothetical protein [Bryobacterales bacterium]